MLRIGEFSKLAKVSVKTLRYYDRIGLLKPAKTDESTSYRYYTEEQLATVLRILSYKAVGISIGDIARLLEGGADEKACLLEQRRLLLEREQELRSMLNGLDALLERQQGQVYRAKLVEVSAQQVYVCRGYVASPHGIHDFIKASAAELAASNPEVKPSLPDYCCVIYPDDGYRESDIFIEYAQSVDRIGKDTPFLQFKQLPAITAVSVTHTGDYADLRNAYAYAVAWASANGYTLCGEPRERYVDGAWNGTPTERWRTELQLPINQRKG